MIPKSGHGFNAPAAHCVLLPTSIAERLEQATKHQRVKCLVATLLSSAIYARRSVPTHSKIVARVVSPRNYKEFRGVMRLFEDVVQRDETYLPRRLAVNKPAKTMAWVPCENILVLRGMPRSSVVLPPSFLSCVHRAFEWYYSQYLPSLDPEAKEAAELVRRHLSLLGVPVEDDADTSAMECESDDIEGVGEEIECVSPPDETRVIFDRGDRMYHAALKLKRITRRRCTLAGEPIAEVDMHASFVAILTHLYAQGEERERLVEMLQTGNFYARFADLAGFTAENVKERFLRDVVFSFRRGGNPLWNAFRQHFPDTAYRLSRDRDCGAVVKVKRKRDINGRLFECRTREGQRFLSRRLSMVESQIFWRGALVRLWKEQGIPAIPIHDCLLVRESDADSAMEMILECAEEVLGFRPAVKVALVM